MSLNITIYTFSLTGQRQTVRGVDWKSVIENWSVHKPSKEERNQEIDQLLRDSQVWRTIAGPEVWRTEVYGSPEAKTLGLTLLPSLSQRNLDVQGAELDRLAWEIEILIQNMAVFVAITPPIIDQMTKTPQNDGMLSRFQNIANATAEAKQLNGGIEIS